MIKSFKKLIKKTIYLLSNNEKIEFKEYMKKEDIFEKNIKEVLSFILKYKIKEKEILQEIKNLNQEKKRNMIDYIIKIRFSKIRYSKNYSVFIGDPEIALKIIEILSKENYYRETIINNINNIQKYEISPYCDGNDIVKSLEVFKKEEFIIILNKISSIEFFLLNCLKFKYTEEEKENLQEIFPDYYFINQKLSTENIDEIREKTSLSNIFFKVYFNEINKENFDFFVKNIKNIKKNNLKCHIINYYLFPCHPNIDNYYNINNFNTKLYLQFFDSNRDLIPIFEEYLSQIIKDRKNHPFFFGKGQDYEFVLGLAEKLILEKELINF